MKWIIKDWADNHLFPEKEFNSFDDAQGFLYETFHKEAEKDTIAYYLKCLKKVFPDFNENWIKNKYLYRDIYATPIYSMKYSTKKLGLSTAIDNIYLANTSHIYPEDRTMNNCVKLGFDVVGLVLNKEGDDG